MVRQAKTILSERSTLHLTHHEIAVGVCTTGFCPPRRAFGASGALNVNVAVQVDGLRPGEVHAPSARDRERAFGADQVSRPAAGAGGRLRRAEGITRRGTSCTSCRCHKGTDRCGQPRQAAWRR
jgi:hypothetical protein